MLVVAVHRRVLEECTGVLVFELLLHFRQAVGDPSQGRHGCRGLDDVVPAQLGVLVVEGELEELRVVCVGNKDIRNGLSEGQAPALTALWQEVAPVLHALANVPDHDAAALGQRIPDGSHQVGGLGANHGENGPRIMLDDARVRLG